MKLQFSLRSLFILQILCCLPFLVISKAWWQNGRAEGVIIETRYGWPAPIVGVLHYPGLDMTNIGGYDDETMRCQWLIEKWKFHDFRKKDRP